MPYPGSNLLSLASGGAIYVRDPHRTLVDEQLNGGAYRPLARRRLETDPALPGRERAAVRHPHRARPADRGRRAADARRGLPQGDAAQRRRGRSRDGRNGRITMADDNSLGTTATCSTKSSAAAARRSAPASSATSARTGCPIGPDMDLLPSQVMRLVHLGAEGEVLESQAIWLCASCEACTTRCPMEIDIAAVMDALRILAIERKAAIPDSHGKQFNRSFLGSVRHHGRVFEVGHDGRLQAPHRRSSVRRWTRCRRCWPRESSPSCPSAAATSRKCGEVFRRAEEEEQQREVRLLSRLQPGIDRLGFRPFHAGGLPRAGHRAGRDSRLGLLRLDAGPRQQRQRWPWPCRC